MKRTKWYHKEKLKLDDMGFDIHTKNYINSILISAMNECGIVDKLGLITNSWCIHAIDEHTCDATNPKTQEPYKRCFRTCSMFQRKQQPIDASVLVRKSRAPAADRPTLP